MGGTITRVRVRGKRTRGRACAETDLRTIRYRSSSRTESAESVGFGGKIKARDFGRSRSREFQMRVRRASGGGWYIIINMSVSYHAACCIINRLAGGTNKLSSINK